MTTRALVGLALSNAFMLGVGIAALGRSGLAFRGRARQALGFPRVLLGVALLGVTLDRARPRCSLLVCDDRAHGPRAGWCEHVARRVH